MKKPARSPRLRDAPLQYAPTNELGVVFLFATVARRRQFHIEEIRAGYPDCIAYRHAGETEKRVRIEFELRSSSFKAHGHDARKCDCIVCWHHDWPEVPKHIEVIELKPDFGMPLKVWIQAAKRSQWERLDKRDRLDWALSKRVTHGDLLLMYRTHPRCRITDIYRFASHQLRRGTAGWRTGECYSGRIERVGTLDSPVFLADLRQHRVLRTAPFVRRNMQGVGHLASEYWSYLYRMICERNPKVRKALSKYAPEKL